MSAGRLRKWQAVSRTGALVAALAFVYSLIAIAGAGREVIGWGAVLAAAGLPVYFWMRRRV
jgi:APA family basic amino acid/polyamine antiporter